MRWLLVVIALAACKKDPPVEEPANDEPTGGGMPADLAQVIEDYVSAFEALASAGERSGTCDELAASFQAALDSAKPALRAFAEHAEQAEMYSAQINLRFGARIDAAATTIGDAVDPCEDDPRFAEYLRLLGQ